MGLEIDDRTDERAVVRRATEIGANEPKAREAEG
jgi:hypothetical protein